MNRSASWTNASTQTGKPGSLSTPAARSETTKSFQASTQVCLGRRQAQAQAVSQLGVGLERQVGVEVPVVGRPAVHGRVRDGRVDVDVRLSVPTYVAMMKTRSRTWGRPPRSGGSRCGEKTIGWDETW